MSGANGSVPVHVGLILDGNRRWAREHGLSVAEGHRRGYENLKKVLQYAIDQGICYVSAYVFSTENWNRGRDEVRDLMKLLLWAMKHEVEQIHKQGIRVRIVGSRLRLSKALVKAIHEAEEKTKYNQRGTLLLCLDYGGQQEIVEAAKRIVANGINPEEITADLLSQYLYAPDVPPIDLLIRTSGERRVSNFMLWQIAYSELLFDDRYWPDFGPKAFSDALDDYAKRQRRFGG